MMRRHGDGVPELTFAVASQLIGRPLAAYGLDSHGVWTRAVACARAAAGLTRRGQIEALSDRGVTVLSWT